MLYCPGFTKGTKVLPFYSILYMVILEIARPLTLQNETS